MSSPSLVNLQASDLVALQRALERGELSSPLSMNALASLRLSHTWAALEPFAQLASLSLQQMISALQRKIPKNSSIIDVVWTGNDTEFSEVRETIRVLQDLIEEASGHIFVAGYQFTQASSIFRPLQKKYKEGKIHCQFVINITRPPMGISDKDHLRLEQDKFRRDVWPGEFPLPEVYYDPRSLKAQSASSMHAKCLVVDRAISYVGSANFTNSGHQRNMELGILLHHPPSAERILSHWGSILRTGRLQPLFPLSA